MKTVIKNIAELIQTEQNPRKWVAGKDMSAINTIKDAFVEVEKGIITAFGSMDDWTGIDDWNNTEIIDAEGGMVFLPIATVIHIWFLLLAVKANL